MEASQFFQKIEEKIRRAATSVSSLLDSDQREPSPVKLPLQQLKLTASTK